VLLGHQIWATIVSDESNTKKERNLERKRKDTMMKQIIRLYLKILKKNVTKEGIFAFTLKLIFLVKYNKRFKCGSNGALFPYFSLDHNLFLLNYFKIST